MNLEPGVVRDAHREYERAREAIGAHRSEHAVAQSVQGTYGLTVSLHDNHSLEVKSSIEYFQGQRFDVDTELYLFLPSGARAQTWSRDELMADFHGQVRLSVPFLSDNGRAVLDEAKRALGKACKVAQGTNWGEGAAPLLENEHPAAQALVEEGRRFAAVFSEIMSGHGARHRKNLRESVAKSQDLDAAAGILAVKSAVGDVGRTVSSVRLALEEGAKAVVDTPGAGIFFELLNEYVTRLYVNYLGRMNASQGRLPKQTKKDTALQIEDLSDTLSRLCFEEAQRDHGYRNQDADESGESAAMRLSHLKKFFQSQLFFETVTQKTIKRMSEPAAILGACLAASGAYTIEIMHNPMVKAYAGQGALVMCLGIFIYVLKDRLKDKFRNKFIQTIQQRFPESEHKLLFRKIRLGVAQSWFRTLKKSELPADVKSLRRTGARSNLENSISEDVLYYKQRIRIQGQTPQAQDGQGSMKALVRINLERYLRYLDDPYKNLFELNEDGSFTERKAHKVYHFYLLTMSSLAGRRVKSTIFRVIVDKRGINRIEAVAPLL